MKNLRFITLIGWLALASAGCSAGSVDARSSTASADATGAATTPGEAVVGTWSGDFNGHDVALEVGQPGEPDADEPIAATIHSTGLFGRDIESHASGSAHVDATNITVTVDASSLGDVPSFARDRVLGFFATPFSYALDGDTLTLTNDQGTFTLTRESEANATSQ